MKKLAAAAICAALALALTGCGNTTVVKDDSGQESTRIVSSEDGVSCAVLTDTETGVQYLLAKCGYGATITPLLNADGTPYMEN